MAVWLQIKVCGRGVEQRGYTPALHVTQKAPLPLQLRDAV